MYDRLDVLIRIFEKIFFVKKIIFFENHLREFLPFLPWYGPGRRRVDEDYEEDGSGNHVGVDLVVLIPNGRKFVNRLDAEILTRK